MKSLLIISTLLCLSISNLYSQALDPNWLYSDLNQLLKDIQTAKREGDTEKYKKLTAQYQVWAEKYLINGTPTRVMK